MKKAFVLLALLWTQNILANTNTIEKQQGDFHARYYLHPITQQPEQLELYTKSLQEEAFLGVICTDASPFPLIQVLLFNDDIFSETPKLLTVSYQLQPKTNTAIPLQAILKVTDNADELSNQIRLELESGHYKTFTKMEAAYQSLLDQLMSHQAISLQLNHRSLGEKELRFSLQGLKALLSPHQALCR